MVRVSHRNKTVQDLRSDAAPEPVLALRADSADPGKNIGHAQSL